MFTNFHAALALQLAEGISAHDVVVLGWDPEEVFESLKAPPGRSRLETATGKTVGPVDWDAFDAQLDAMAQSGARAVSLWDVDYPESLRYISEPPPLLFYKGRIEILAARGVAVVGTRKPTPAGVTLARRLGRALAAARLSVVSGLARGIDTAAHVGALAAGERAGEPVAVIGTGIDVPYPAENAALMVDVGRAGCVVSEQLMGMHAERWVFPRRNRLISALSHAVVVVQGGIKSGALITARWALEQGRDVGAVPGFPGDFRSDGPNALIKQGAFVVEDVRDVIAAVPALRYRSPVPTAEGAADSTSGAAVVGGLCARVLAALGSTPVGVDDVSAALDCAVEDAQRALSELEIDGRVGRDAMGRYTTTPRG